MQALKTFLVHVSKKPLGSISSPLNAANFAQSALLDALDEVVHIKAFRGPS